MVVTLRSVLAWLNELALVYTRQKLYLTELDAAIGDADHGINLERGFTAVKVALENAPPTTIGAALKTTAMTLIRTVGGASGPLYGTWFLQAAFAAGTLTELGARELVSLVEAAVDGVIARGKSQPGQKTMIDVWVPARQAMQSALGHGGDVATVLDAAVAAAEQGAHATIDMVATKGRAGFLGERSRGHQDPGATSSLLLLQTARGALPA